MNSKEGIIQLLNELIEQGEKFRESKPEELKLDSYEIWMQGCITHLANILPEDHILSSSFIEKTYALIVLDIPEKVTYGIQILEIVKEGILAGTIQIPMDLGGRVIGLAEDDSKIQKFLNVENVQDDFYIQLIKEINLLYYYEIPTALWIMIRKLFENLLIDILRKRYGNKVLESRNLYCRKENGRHHDFNILLKNFKGKINDFREIIPDLNQDLIQPLIKFRERAGSSAHNLTVKTSMKEIDGAKNDLIYLVKIFFRLYKEIIT